MPRIKMLKKVNNILDTVVNSTEEFLQQRCKYVKGQFFTPISIAKFMASLCDIDSTQTSIKILDPGAGTGILTICLLLKIIQRKEVKEIHADLYETDTKLVYILRKNISTLKQKVEKQGIKFTFKIINKDYIFHNSDAWQNKIDGNYDVIIANPPYFKLSKTDEVCSLMPEIVYGQPNIYIFFMAMSSILLRDKGQMIFITPRSYCSGLYFKAFRKWFLNIMKPVRIHIFESRKKAFNDEVLQETIILKALKTRSKNINVNISSSFDADFKKDYYELKQIPLQIVLSDNDPELFLKLPTTEKDLEILEFMSRWPNTLLTIGYKLSTGPVVDFRSKEFLLFDKEYNGKNTAPLFWMHNINGFTSKWPAPNGNKPASIIISKDSLTKLVRNKNYVFVKRFTAKEQRRRIYAAVFVNSEFKTSHIGIENHLNYIWRTNNENMCLEEAYGLMAFLNSTIVEKYFRIVSGSTQVNATEINNMPIPDLENIVTIGKIVMNDKPKNINEIDDIVNEVLSYGEKVKENTWGKLMKQLKF